MQPDLLERARSAVTVEREIRIRGPKTDAARFCTIRCVSDYISTYMNDGRGMGQRNGVITTLGKATVYVYHTKTAIVGLYREASHG